jgi:hypothetical protein
VLCRAGPDALTLQSCTEEAALRLRLPGAFPPQELAIRADALSAIEGRSGVASLEEAEPGKGRARWLDGGVDRAAEFVTVTPDSVPPFPALPEQWSAMPPHLLSALAEAARTASHDAGGRYSLTRLQLRGGDGEIAASDGRQLLLQTGYSFPWEKEALVPALSAFGSPELREATPLEVGRTDKHVALRVGPWELLLEAEASGRYPDVHAAVPRTRAASARLRLGPEDAELLARSLPGLPGGEEPLRPVTLELGPTPLVRARSEPGGPVAELRLGRSAATGKRLRLCLDRRYLLRALELGFTELEIHGAAGPVVCRGGGRVYLWMALDPRNALDPDDTEQASSGVRPIEPPPTEKREDAMPAPEPDNGHAPRPEPAHGSSNGEAADPVAEAEALRGLLQQAGARLGRLLAALKHQRRQARAVEAAMQSLRRLRLDG